MMRDAHADYRFEDRSLLLRWLKAPLFMPIVRAVPAGLTPNQITMAGHVCMWSTAAVALLAPPAGRLVPIALAFGYTAFNLADIVDGMYARHSGRTSRLGELLDHGLDPFGTALVPLTYGIALGEPAWLILASTASIAYLQFVTFLHGYRVGYVILGEIGVIEGLALVAAVCAAAALGARPALTRVLFADVSTAGLIALGFIAAALPAFVSMRGVFRHAADLVPPALLIAGILAWYAFGALGARAAGLLVLFASAYEMMRVTSARLRGLALSLWDPPFTAALAAAVTLSIALAVRPAVQAGLAAALIVYTIGQSARLFSRTVAVLRP